MKYSLEIKQEAYLEIQDAYNYYEKNRVGLGERFIKHLDFYIERIQKHPEHYQKRREPYREAFIKDFPFLIIYEVLENKIVIYSVFNTKRNPIKKGTS
jgi:plasmid stabilization system protein ParE